MLGEDFSNARSRWLYPCEPMQNFWRAALMTAVLFGLFVLMQSFCAILVYTLGFGGSLYSLRDAASGAAGMPNDQMVTFLRATVIGMFPAGLPVALLAVYFSQFGLPGRRGTVPLQWPKIGAVGWVFILVAFVLVMGVVFNGIFAGLGIDPSTYETTAKGLNDAKSQAGIVEKTLADLAQSPQLFILAMPGVIITAPLVEEILFRGLLFAGIAKTRLGWPGAVIITAALWAVAHAGAAPWLFVGILFCMGLVLGLLLLRFGSLWVTIACHTAWNVLSTLVMFSAGTH